MEAMCRAKGGEEGIFFAKTFANSKGRVYFWGEKYIL
jgi:hypothetical protein